MSSATLNKMALTVRIGFFALFVLFCTHFASAQFTWVVTSTDDPDPFLSRNPNDPSLVGTLQWAIRQSNSIGQNSVNTILFNIPGTPPHIINLNNQLPTITSHVLIDGTSQPGYQPTFPAVIIDGINKIGIGLLFGKNSFTGNTVKGLHLRKFTTYGMDFFSIDGLYITDNVITQCGRAEINFLGNDLYFARNLIGTDGSFSAVGDFGEFLGSGGYGIYIVGRNNTIGGPFPSDKNVIANNGVGINLASTQIITDRNLITQNEIYDNEKFAINFGEHANNNKISPVIESVSPDGEVSGKADPGDIVEIFGSTGRENANQYRKSGQANNTGNWTMAVGPLPWSHIVSTATDPNRNTSRLSQAINYPVRSPLEVVITADVPKCAEEDVTFAVTSNYDLSGALFEWDFGDLITASGYDGTSISGVTRTGGTYDNPTHVYLSTGIYAVTLKVTLSDGQEATIRYNVPIQDCSSSTTVFRGALFIESSVDDLTVCGPDKTMTIKITNELQVAIELNQVVVVLPPHVIFRAGLLITPSQSGQTLTFDMMGQLLSPGATFNLLFTVYVGCSALNEISATHYGMVENEVNVKFSFPGNAAIFEENELPHQYMILFPIPVISSLDPDVILSNNNLNIERIITIQNSGIGVLSEFTLVYMHDPGTETTGLTATGISYTTTTTPGSDVFHITLTPPLKYNENIDITHHMKYTGCDFVDENYRIEWGCNSEICFTDEASASVDLNLGQPDLSLVLLDYTGVNYCGLDDEVILKITNNGSESAPFAGMATNVILNLSYTQGVVEYIDFDVNGDGTTATGENFGISNNGTTFQILNSTLLSGGTAGSWDINFTNAPTNTGLSDYNNDLKYSELGVGESFYIKFKIHVNCDPAFATECPLHYSHSYLQTQLSYSNKCFSRPFHENLDKFAQTVSIGASSKPCQTLDYGPPDINNLDVKEFKFCVNAFLSGPKCPNGFFRVEVTLPDGVSPVLQDAAVDGNTSLASASFAPGNFQVVYIDGNSFAGCYSIPLKLDYCNSATSLEQLFTIQWRFLFICDPACTCIQQLGCDQISFTGHFESCPQLSCQTGAMKTISLTVTRTTLGWTDPSRATKVLATNPDLKLNAAYTCDNFVAVADGIVVTDVPANYERHVVFTYRLPSNDNFIELIGPAIAEITFNTGIIKSCTLSSPTITISITQPYVVLVDFKVAPPCFKAGMKFFAGEKLKLTANFHIRESNTLPYDQTYQDLRFRATHYTMPNKSTQFTCGGIGAQFDILKPVHSFEANPSLVLARCSPVTLGFTWMQHLCSDDDFPNEFRNVGKLNGITITIPAGYDYFPNSAQFVTEAGGGFTSQIFSTEPVITGSVLTFYPTGGFPNQDKCKTDVIQNFVFMLQPHCTASDIGTVNYQVEWTEFDQSDDALCKANRTEIFNQTIYHFNPDLRVKADKQILHSTTKNVVFNLNLINANSNAPSPFTWLSFEPANPGNIAIAEVKQHIPPGSNLSLIPFGPFNQYNWVQAGFISGNSSKTLQVTVNYVVCQPETIVVKASWNCQGYPSDPSLSECTVKTFTIILEPEETDFVVYINEVTPTAACSAELKYLISFISTKEGTLYLPFLSMGLPENVSIIEESSSVSFLPEPVGNGTFSPVSDPVLAGTGEFVWNIGAIIPFIGLNGIPGTSSVPLQNAFELQFSVHTPCKFEGHVRLEGSMTAKDICENEIIAPVTSNYIREKDLTDLVISNLLTDVDECGEPIGQISFSMKNLGENVAPGDDIIIDFYCDGNGKFDDDDVFVNSVSYTGGIAEGQTLPLSFPVTGYCSSIDDLVVVIDNAKPANCICQPVAAITDPSSFDCPTVDPLTCEHCIASFAPFNNQKYVVSAWVKEANSTGAATYLSPQVVLLYLDQYGTELNASFQPGPLLPAGAIIDGWQKIEGAFTIHPDAKKLKVVLKNTSASTDVFFDDIRIHPFRANMKTFAYDPVTFRLMAEHDENNFASFYEYDEEGALIRVKKETERGIMTIQESRNNTKKH